MTLQYLGAFWGKLEIMQLFVRDARFDIKERNIDGASCLGAAVGQQRLDVTKLLLSLPDIDVNSAYNNGVTSLHSVAKYNI
jgi:ankyrin repeat protein